MWMRHTRELYRAAKGPSAEDTWQLIYEDGRLFVRHAWARIGAQQGGGTDNGQVDMDLEIFLNEPAQSNAHEELRRILDLVFDDA
jgi:hypothetical protein